MKITTKTGDDGFTSMYLGGRMRKDDIRTEVCGALDEACSFLGMARSLIRNKAAKNMISGIQKELLSLCSEASAHPARALSVKAKVGAQAIRRIERLIDGLESKRPRHSFCFSLPGEDPVSSIFHIARSVVRKAERRAVTLYKGSGLNKNMVIYLNRLSDLLYLIAVDFENTQGRTADKRYLKITVC